MEVWSGHRPRVSLAEEGHKNSLGKERTENHLARPPVAGMHSHALSEALFHDGGKGPIGGQLKVSECEVGCNRAARERAGIVRLEMGHLLCLVTIPVIGVRLVGLALAG